MLFLSVYIIILCLCYFLVIVCFTHYYCVCQNCLPIQWNDLIDWVGYGGWPTLCVLPLWRALVLQGSPEWPREHPPVHDGGPDVHPDRTGPHPRRQPHAALHGRPLLPHLRLRRPRPTAASEGHHVRSRLPCHCLHGFRRPLPLPLLTGPTPHPGDYTIWL